MPTQQFVHQQTMASNHQPVSNLENLSMFVYPHMESSYRGHRCNNDNYMIKKRHIDFK